MGDEKVSSFFGTCGSSLGATETKSSFLMWCCEFLTILFVALCIVCPILWIFSGTVRFWVKTVLYYACVFSCSQVLVIFVVPNYGDPANFKYVKWLFLAFTRWLKIKWQIRGAEYLKSNQPFIVICNHQSALDLVGMMECWPDRCVPMMKSTMRYFGLMGISAAGSGSVFIERYNKDSARATINKAADQIKNSQVKLWVFPEGTRNSEGGMLPFKKGSFHLAIQTKAPIVPVVFSSYKSFYDKTSKKFLSEGFVIAEALPPIETANLTVDDISELSANAREKMMALFEKNSLEAARIFENHEF